MSNERLKVIARNVALTGLISIPGCFATNALGITRSEQTQTPLAAAKAETKVPAGVTPEVMQAVKAALDVTATRVVTDTVRAQSVLTDTVRIETGTPVVEGVVLPSFPKTSQEAASLFGGTANRWAKSADGGWHLREEGSRIKIDPRGYLTEGYYDTKPGRDAQCLASAGVAIEVQGATVWPAAGSKVEAENLQKKMAIPVWTDGKQHPCQVVLPDAKK